MDDSRSPPRGRHLRRSRGDGDGRHSRLSVSRRSLSLGADADVFCNRARMNSSQGGLDGGIADVDAFLRSARIGQTVVSDQTCYDEDGHVKKTHPQNRSIRRQAAVAKRPRRWSSITSIATKPQQQQQRRRHSRAMRRTHHEAA